MSLFGQIALVSLLWLVVGIVIALAAGRLLRGSRRLLEADAIRRCRRAITGFLNQEEDNAVMIYRDRQSGKIKSEEAMTG